MKSVAICITYYNEQNLLTELLRSLVSNQEQPDEIIVYDDCSVSPAQYFIPTGVVVKVIRGTENRGPAYGRNRLIENSKSDYVHFHDADDLFLPDWLGRIREVIANRSPEAIFTEVTYYKDGEAQPQRSGLDKFRESGDLLGFCIDHGMQPAAGTFSRKLLLNVGGYPESLWQSEDYAFHIRIASKCSNFIIISEPMVGIRLRNDSRSSNAIEVFRDGIRALKLVAPDLPSGYRSRLADAAVRISRHLYHIGDVQGAREGFECAANLGPASYRGQHWGYRLCVKLAGPFYTETISSTYRRLPKRFRKAVR